MYADFYGLKRRPFRADPRGSEVFVGPQTARLVKCMNSALFGSDAVITISGAAGLGKSTLARRALDAHADRLSVIHIPRAQLAHDEVLGFLLEQLGAGELPRSTIRQVLLCRSLIADAEDGGKSVCVVVEDATRIGADALIELEALTASDGNEEHGGRIVLLGSEDLPGQLKSPPLKRLQQRTRIRFVVEPLNAGELQGYLRHCFRLAGREFDEIFQDGASAALYGLTGGVPRLTNHLVESVLATAAEDRAERIDISLIAKIARDEYDLETTDNPGSTGPAQGQSAVREDTGNAGSSGAAADPAREDHDEMADTSASDLHVNDPLPDISEFADCLAIDPLEATGETDEIPTLFESSRLTAPVAAVDPQPTRTIDGMTGTHPPTEPTAAAPPVSDAPDVAPEVPAEVTPGIAPQVTLEVTPEAAPELTTEVDAVPPAPGEAEPEDDSTADITPVKPQIAELPVETPNLVMADAAKPNPHAPQAGEAAPVAPPVTIPDAGVAADAPEWERDPTLAQLRPDIEALELAMANFGDESQPQKEDADQGPDPDIELRDPTLMGVPDITLDAAIQEKIAEAQEALEKHDQTIAEEEIEDVPAAAADPSMDNTDDINESEQSADPAADAQYREVADGIARARSIEDVDDKMAETLFGEEFSAIAAQVAANAPDLAGDEEDSGDLPPALEIVDSPAVEKASAPEPEPGLSGKSALEKEFMEVYGEDALEVSLQSDVGRGGLDLSASQRLATVRALNAEKNSSTGKFAKAGAGSAVPSAPVPPGPAPQPIEEQITTSMTQTLKALSARPASANDEDDDEEPRGGFFSRFRRS